MARDDSDSPRDPEGKRNASGKNSRGSERANPNERANSWAPRRGRSGYGVESIRPHLRAQLEHQKLLRPTFPPETDEPDLSSAAWKDAWHR